MAAVKLADNVYWIGANVHTEDLFEGIWPTPNGVTLNAYVVKGDKTAVIELVREWGGASLSLLQNLQSLGVAPQHINYIVLNHLEPDHSGFTYTLRNLAPDA